MFDVLFPLLFVGTIGSLFALVLLHQRNSIRRAQAQLADDPDVELIPHAFSFTLVTRRPHPEADVRPAGGGKNNPARWDVTAAVRMPADTTLELSKEGFFGGLREAVGLKDIHVGDEHFDREFTVRGSDRELIVELLSDALVQRSVHELFALRVWTLTIDAGGAVSVRAQRRGHDVEAAKALLLGTVQLCQAIEAHAGTSAVWPSGSH